MPKSSLIRDVVPDQGSQSEFASEAESFSNVLERRVTTPSI